MKVGDLVKKKSYMTVSRSAANSNEIAIVVETGIYVGNRDIMVLWNDGTKSTQISKTMEVVSDY